MRRPLRWWVGDLVLALGMVGASYGLAWVIEAVMGVQ